MKKHFLFTYIFSLIFISCTTPNGDLAQKHTPASKNDTNDNIQKNNCNNGQLNYGEECDGELFGTAKCTTLGLGYTAGQLKCTSDCKIDHSECTSVAPQNCGDGVIGKGEECDGENLNKKDCTSF